MLSFFFFFNDTATTEIYTLSLHDALPILLLALPTLAIAENAPPARVAPALWRIHSGTSTVYLFGSFHILRSAEHTSELQSRQYLVCRLLLEKKTVRASITVAE